MGEAGETLLLGLHERVVETVAPVAPLTLPHGGSERQ